ARLRPVRDEMREFLLRAIPMRQHRDRSPVEIRDKPFAAYRPSSDGKRHAVADISGWRHRAMRGIGLRPPPRGMLRRSEASGCEHHAGASADLPLARRRLHDYAADLIIFLDQAAYRQTGLEIHAQ